MNKPTHRLYVWHLGNSDLCFQSRFFSLDFCGSGLGWWGIDRNGKDICIYGWVNGFAMGIQRKGMGWNGKKGNWCSGW